MKHKLIAVFVLFSALLLAGCGFRQAAGATLPTATPTPEVVTRAELSSMLEQFGSSISEEVKDQLNDFRQEMSNGSIAASATPESSQANPTPVPVPQGSVATLSQPAISNTSQGNWRVTGYERLSESPAVQAWISRLQAPAPALWPTYPNVPNPLVPAFKVDGNQVPWGVEYGVPNVPFCQQDSRCDFIVPAWHYRLITADYTFQGWSCSNTADDPKGCMLLLINVMDTSYTWRDQMADNGFSVAGRYWDGDNLEWGVWGLVSHTAASMLNMPTVRNSVTGDILNAGTPGNAGANCGHVNGCSKIDVRVVIHAGDALVAVLETTVTQ